MTAYIVSSLSTAGLAYLLGSFPAGYLVGRVRGIDIRTAGSGNIGATNVFRVLGTTAGTIVLVVDGLKGWLAVTEIPELIQRCLVAHSRIEPGISENHRGCFCHSRP